MINEFKNIKKDQIWINIYFAFLQKQSGKLIYRNLYKSPSARGKNYFSGNRASRINDFRLFISLSVSGDKLLPLISTYWRNFIFKTWLRRSFSIAPGKLIYRTDSDELRLKKYLPGPGKITPVDHSRFRENYFWFSVVPAEMHETPDEGGTEQVGQFFSVDTPLAL